MQASVVNPCVIRTSIQTKSSVLGEKSTETAGCSTHSPPMREHVIQTYLPVSSRQHLTGPKVKTTSAIIHEEVHSRIHTYRPVSSTQS